MLNAKLQNVAFYAKNIVNFDFGDGNQPNDNRTPKRLPLLQMSMLGVAFVVKQRIWSSNT